MGVRQLDVIVAGLRTALPAHTPAALVQSASTPQEQRLVCTLATVQQRAASAGIASPAVLIVGDVLAAAASAAALAEQRATATHG
jgi:uroporphyrin-III C-methyltransferase